MKTRADYQREIDQLTVQVRRLEADLKNREATLSAVSGTKDACQFAIVNLREELAAQKAKAEAAVTVVKPTEDALAVLREHYDTLALIASALARQVGG